MMFRITHTLSANDLLRFLCANKTVDVTIESIEPAAVEPASPQPQARVKRGSKVNAAILKALKGDTVVTVADLKAALVQAGLAASSLPTGLAQLQKSGEIMRAGDGLYALAERIAAE